MLVIDRPCNIQQYAVLLAMRNYRWAYTVPPTRCGACSFCHRDRNFGFGAQFALLLGDGSRKIFRELCIHL